MGWAVGVAVGTGTAQPRSACLATPCAERPSACAAPLPAAAFGQPPGSAREPVTDNIAATPTISAERMKTVVSLNFRSALPMGSSAWSAADPSQSVSILRLHNAAVK